MAGRDHEAPSIREIAELTARLRRLSTAGRDADPAERAAFLADKNGLLARIDPDTRDDIRDRDDDADRDAVDEAVDDVTGDEARYAAAVFHTKWTDQQVKDACWAVAARDCAIERGDADAAALFAAQAREAIADVLATGATLDELAYDLDYPGGAVEIDGPHIDQQIAAIPTVTRASDVAGETAATGAGSTTPDGRDPDTTRDAASMVFLGGTSGDGVEREQGGPVAHDLPSGRSADAAGGREPPLMPASWPPPEMLDGLEARRTGPAQVDDPAELLALLDQLRERTDRATAASSPAATRDVDDGLVTELTRHAPHDPDANELGDGNDTDRGW